VSDAPLLQINLQCHEHHKEELVFLVQAPAGVAETLQVQVVDDVLDTLGRHRALV